MGRQDDDYCSLKREANERFSSRQNYRLSDGKFMFREKRRDPPFKPSDAFNELLEKTLREAEALGRRIRVDRIRKDIIAKYQQRLKGEKHAEIRKHRRTCGSLVKVSGGS